MTHHDPYKTKLGTQLPIMDMKGKPYLQVAYRVVWFREEHSDWSITTTPVQLTPELAIFRCEVRDDGGNLLATAHKTCTAASFRMGYVEKAETGAIGRALAFCGYGTQFCADELDEEDELADTPLKPVTKAPQHTPPPQQTYEPVIEESLDALAAAAYVVPFGKWKGKKLREIQLNELVAYKMFIERKADEEKKPITGPVKEFIDAVCALQGLRS